MSTKHWLVLALVVVGGLYVFHMYATHGSFGQFKSGLGIQR